MTTLPHPPADDLDPDQVAALIDEDQAADYDGAGLPRLRLHPARGLPRRLHLGVRQPLLEVRLMLRFGGPWGCEGCEEILAPVGEPCLHCEEPIAAGDQGVVMTYMDADGGDRLVPEHRECFLRGVLGSVGHQLRECSCFGGSGTGDPPGLSRREAAIAAVAHFKP